MTPTVVKSSGPSAAPRRSPRTILVTAFLIQSLVTMALTVCMLAAGEGIAQSFALLSGLLLVTALGAVLGALVARRLLPSLTGAFPDHQESSSVRVPDPELPTELETTKRRLEMLMTRLPWPLWMTTPAGVITHHNVAAARLLESEGADLRGRTLDEWISPDSVPESWSEFRCNAQDGARWHGEMNAVTGQGRSLRLDLTAEPVVVSAGCVQSVLYMAVDVTEMHELQNLVIDMERMSTRGRMAGEIAHEINNYLTILGGNLDIIPMLLATGNHEKVTSKFLAMKQVLDKIARFSDGLMGHRDDDPEPVPCDVNRLIENLIAFLRPQNRYDGIDLSWHGEANLPKVTVNVGQIQQVMVNLLNNAADAVRQVHRQGGQIEVSSRLIPGRGEVAISVRDNGPGVSEEASARIFRERYSDKKSGHGLGLINCHRIAQAHRGTLTVESAAGEGATFTLTLPGGREPVPEGAVAAALVAG